MSNPTENPTPHEREAPNHHPAAEVQACFPMDDCQRPFIDRKRIVETAQQWAEVRERVRTLIFENAWLLREIDTLRDENADLQRLVEFRELDVKGLRAKLAVAERAAGAGLQPD